MVRRSDRNAGPPTNNLGVLSGTYTTPFSYVGVQGVLTHTMLTGSCRGAGRPPDRTRIKVRIGQGQKGPQVAQVAGADASTTQVPSRAERRPSPRLSSHGAGAEPTEECLGSVKWFNVEKGFGFVAADRGGKDVFVHATTLDRSGLSGLPEGQRVRMQICQGQKGPEARSIELLD
jgi:CspA family cold shock protein